MKTLLILLIAFLVFVNVGNAQEKRPSPAAKATGIIGDAEIEINYSSPAVKGRQIWGELVPYGKVWRTGANEATIFSSTKDLKINGKFLPAGEYSLFTIPGDKEWVVIFNSEAKQWGAYNYKEEKDVLRVNVKPERSKRFNERMAFTVDDGKRNGTIHLNWENLTIPLKVSMND